MPTHGCYHLLGVADEVVSESLESLWIPHLLFRVELKGQPRIPQGLMRTSELRFALVLGFGAAGLDALQDLRRMLCYYPAHSKENER
jgi:hypothetical protein